MLQAIIAVNGDYKMSEVSGQILPWRGKKGAIACFFTIVHGVLSGGFKPGKVY
jgi:hypothetical protein